MERLSIALHLTQELLPVSGAGSLVNGQPKAPSKVIGSGSGYGPPLASEGTPLSRLVSSTLYVPPAEPSPVEAAQGWTGVGSRTEYDLVCIPLTNRNWQERWDRMCTISSSGTVADFNMRNNNSSARNLGEDQTRTEAEAWRAGGGFGRGEVNVTRSGKFRSIFPFQEKIRDWNIKTKITIQNIFFSHYLLFYFIFILQRKQVVY